MRRSRAISIDSNSDLSSIPLPPNTPAVSDAEFIDDEEIEETKNKVSLIYVCPVAQQFTTSIEKREEDPQGEEARKVTA